MMFLNILSVLNQIKPTKLYIHTLSPPHGKYWERLSSYSQYVGIVEIRPIPEPIGLFGNFPEPNDFAHKSDCARMNILKSMGGIYLDLDVLVLHPFTDLLRYPMVLGKQYLKTLTVCNAVVIASKNSLFLQEWMEGYRQANFSTCWDCSSVQYPSNLLTNNEALRKATYILPVEAYYDPSFSRSDIRELFVENDN